MQVGLCNKRSNNKLMHKYRHAQVNLYARGTNVMRCEQENLQSVMKFLYVAYTLEQTYTHVHGKMNRKRHH